MGKPVVVAPWLAEVAQAKLANVVFCEPNANSLAEALLRSRVDGPRTIEVDLEDYDWDRIVKQFEEISVQTTQKVAARRGLPSLPRLVNRLNESELSRSGIGADPLLHGYAINEHPYFVLLVLSQRWRTRGSRNALLARAFVARGHAVKVMTMTRSTEPDNDTFDIMREPGTSDLVRAIRWCDVFLQANVSFRLGWPNFFLRRPWVISLHGNLDAEEGRDGIFSWKSRLKRLSLFVADRVISVSRAVAIRTFPQALVIGNPYRTDVFQHRPDAARPYDLVFLGRLVSDKGVHILIDALALLGERDLRPSLLIIGGGPEESALRERCRTYNLTTQVTFAGVRRGEELASSI